MALLKTLANIVAVVKARTLEQKLVNGEPKALVDLLANALAEILMQRYLATHLLRCRPSC